ncbi:vWA domain-containing protein [Streptococcus phocae]|nr:vWA domain-containing protein [Streptococcus phocae]
MTDADFNTAKQNIQKLVTTLTSPNTKESPNHNNRNSVRLIDFYREIGEPIDLSGLPTNEVGKKLDELRKKSYDKWNWGVNLQGAIHKAREILNSNPEKNSGKRQHIVLFSQGEATFSYALTDEAKKKTQRLTDMITSSNPLLPWPAILNHSNKNRDMLDDIKILTSLGKELGIEELSNLDSTLKLASTGSSILGILLGGEFNRIFNSSGIYFKYIGSK